MPTSMARSRASPSRGRLPPVFAFTVYVPGATPLKTYVPSGRCAAGPVPRSPAPASISVFGPAGESVTRSICSGAPDGSVTLPEIVAVGTYCNVMSAPPRSSLNPSAIVAAAAMSVTPG